MKTIILLTLSVVFTSCMHIGGMGMQGGGDSAYGMLQAEFALEKEVIVRELRATAIFPPLELGRETVFTLELTDVKTNQPAGPAPVSFHATFLQMAEGTPDLDMHQGKEQKLEDSVGLGMYSVVFVPRQPGEHQFMFHISELVGPSVDPEIVIKAQRTVKGPNPQNSHGMMHGGEDYLIVGGALMGVMMIAVLVAGGKMF